MRKIITLKLKLGVNHYDGGKGHPLKVLSFIGTAAGYKARIMVNDTTGDACTFTVAPDGAAAPGEAGALVGWTDTVALFSSCFSGM